MDTLIQLAKDLASAFEGHKTVNIELVEQDIPDRSPVQIDPIAAPLEAKTDLLIRAWKAAHDQEHIVKVTGSLGIVTQYVQVATSEGKLSKDARTRVRMSVTAYAQEGDNMQSGFNGPGASRGLEFFDMTTPEDIAQEAVRQAQALLKAKDAPSGKMPVIIENGFGGVIFHEACGHSLEATAVAKNQSVFAGRLGQQIANEKVTAIDDGTIPFAWGSQNMDDEGNPQQKRVLIEKGILKTYMIDRLNGRRMQAESTGSGRRQSYQYEPTSRMSNTFIAPGNDTLEDMLAGIEKGLYARRMGGGSVNPQTGEFNFSVSEGYLIENGRITDPVRGASLIGTGQEILMNIDMVGSNLERAQGICGSVSGSIPTDVGQPVLRVKEITVGGTANA
jgi:TldD protein